MVNIILSHIIIESRAMLAIIAHKETSLSSGRVIILKECSNDL